MADPYNLQRFIAAQAPVYTRVQAELREGRKRSHFMWFIFPQLKGLGHSATAQHFAIGTRGEAQAYLAHPELGARLRDCTCLVNAVEQRTITEILGTPDDLKFRSSMTLFAQVTSDNELFIAAIEKYYGGELDRRTLDLLTHARV